MAEFTSFSVFLCEKILVEANNVLSAIRLVDVFVVPDERPSDFYIEFWLAATGKLKAGEANTPHRFTFTLVRSDGQREKLGEQTSRPREFGDPSIPLGTGVVMQFRFGVQALGTFYIEIDVDGKVEASVPFTLLPSSVLPPSNPLPQK